MVRPQNIQRIFCIVPTQSQHYVPNQTELQYMHSPILTQLQEVLMLILQLLQLHVSFFQLLRYFFVLRLQLFVLALLYPDFLIVGVQDLGQFCVGILIAKIREE